MKNTIPYAALFIVFGAVACFAQEGELGKVTAPVAKNVTPIHRVSLKQVQGEISGIGKKYISVIYARNTATGDESEIMIPFNPGTVKLEHARSLNDFTQGDQVRVQYNEEYKKDETQDKTNFDAKVISLIKKGVKKAAPSETDVLKSAEVEEQE